MIVIALPISADRMGKGSLFSDGTLTQPACGSSPWDKAATLDSMSDSSTKTGAFKGEGNILAIFRLK